MRTTTLGPGGPELGVLGLGCMGMTHAYDTKTPRDDTTSVAVILPQALGFARAGGTPMALDLGMTLIDTADVYGPLTNEELVGRALRDRRDRAVLATKVGLLSRDSEDRHVRGPNGHPEHVRLSIDESLRRLGTDHVDLYQLHRVDPAVPIEETWGALAETVAAGKARNIGLSEVTAEQIKRAQLRTNLALVGKVREIAERSETRVPPAGGWARIGASPAQVALAWVLAQGEYVIPIPGTKTPKYLADNAGAADVELSPADLAELDALPTPEGGRY